MQEATADLDAIDKSILNALQLDGRMTNTDLAERIGLSPSACFRRVRRLEESGVIDHYTMRVSATAIGRPLSVFVEISLTSQNEDLLDEFEAVVGDCSEVRSCHLMASDADYLVHIECANMADYERIHRSHLAQLPGVAKLRSMVAIRAVTDHTNYQLD